MSGALQALFQNMRSFGVSGKTPDVEYLVVAGGAGGGGGTPGTNGGTNTGGGGGGGAGQGSVDGRAGGSGIVIIRYADSYDAALATTGSPTITVAGGYRVYQWTSSGSITF